MSLPSQWCAICISESTKDNIWNLEHTDLSLLLQHKFNCKGVKHNFLSLADGKLLMHLTNKPPKVKQIDSIEILTDAFSNNHKYNNWLYSHPGSGVFLLQVA
jgi:hypothetical protein